jgi:hypothetical protein
VTLLGQNIDAYGRDLPGFAADGSGRRLWTFTDLLRHIHDIDGIERIRYATSHPRYFTGGEPLRSGGSRGRAMRLTVETGEASAGASRGVCTGKGRQCSLVGVAEDWLGENTLCRAPPPGFVACPLLGMSLRRHASC